MLETAFNRLGMFKIYSHVIAFNADSKKYASACGYIEEARLPQEHWREGQRHDEIIFAVYEEGWRKAYKAWQKDQTARFS
jgi:RimJ/RimL family protein N-acetyltransferase